MKESDRDSSGEKSRKPRTARRKVPIADSAPAAGGESAPDAQGTSAPAEQMRSSAPEPAAKPSKGKRKKIEISNTPAAAAKATAKTPRQSRPKRSEGADSPVSRSIGTAVEAPAKSESKSEPAATPAAVIAKNDGEDRDQFSLLSDVDLHLFNEGTHYHLFDKLGSRRVRIAGEELTYFAVWAPNAERVCVFGDFNGWNKESHPLRNHGSGGIWEGVVDAPPGTRYKYHVVSRFNGYRADKADPFAWMHEAPPATGSIVTDLEYQWSDGEWMESREGRNGLQAPMSIYELHVGSWMRVPEEGDRPMTYREMAGPLVRHLKETGFTHVELMPVMEHPFYGSWGYQSTGWFAPTSRFGTPQDLMYLIDQLHQNGIGVILDWVPSHFPSDEHGLSFFDGTHLFEHADPRQGFHPDWNSLIFNYGRNEVRSFLMSSAVFWLRHFHADALRFDAVASMLYLDYSRKQGEWIPNRFGGRENIEAVDFLRRLNEVVYETSPGAQTIAEESTAWPMVSRPTWLGGLGFGMKWDMGWMHDTLAYMSHDPIHRRFHHNSLTFRMMYAYTENFVLPLSHDEVVHGKGSLIGKMPGDDWQKFANLRLLFGYMYAQPGKKLMFMGGEIGQWREWSHDRSLDWHLLEQPMHQGMKQWVSDLNAVYRDFAAMHRFDTDPRGFDWIDCCDSDQSVISVMRRGEEGDPPIIGVFNFTPLVRHNYRIGAPSHGQWREILNSDAPTYGGSGQGNLGGAEAAPVPSHGRPFSLSLTLPPLGAIFLTPEGEETHGER
jgi:1,4-alpha-glucan branching enzyme